MGTSKTVQTRIARGIGLLGAIFLLYMIIVEDEPGALPLGLIGISIVWQLGMKINAKNK